MLRDEVEEKVKKEATGVTNTTLLNEGKMLRRFCTNSNKYNEM